VSGGRRILIATADVLGASLAGPAIRAWQMAAELSNDHDVTLLSVTAPCSRPGDGFRAVGLGDVDIAALDRWSEILVVQGFVLRLAPELGRTDALLVADLYDPLHFERLELYRADDRSTRDRAARDAVDVLSEQISRADLLLCASERQRDLWLGWLSALGRVNPRTYDRDHQLRDLLAVVGFGLPEDPPQRQAAAVRGVIPGIDADAEIVLWAGGIYEWLDPEVLIRAIDLLRRQRPRVRLVFMATRHPGAGGQEMPSVGALRASAKALGLLDRFVFLHDGWVEFERRADFLLDADVGVSTHHLHLETEFSYRTRMLDYLWAGLPTVCSQGDALAGLVERHQLGLTVPPGDARLLADALGRLLGDASLAASCRSRIAEVRDELRWSKVLQPLLQFCADPRRAADRDPPTAPVPDAPPGGPAERTQVPGHAEWFVRPAAAGLRELHQGGVRQLSGAVWRRLRRASGRATPPV
jgi:glycosyltransferase involved in cell wall biosynthesis